MAETKSFHDILIEKMTAQESEKPLFSEGSLPNSPLYSQAPYDLINQLLGHAETAFFNRSPHFSLLKTPYKAATPLAKKAKPAPVEKTVLFSQLSNLQKTALEKLISLGANELRGLEVLGETRIKKCFRRLAKTLHPDIKQQSSQSFRELRQSYNILANAFNSAACDT